MWVSKDLEAEWQFATLFPQLRPIYDAGNPYRASFPGTGRIHCAVTPWLPQDNQSSPQQTSAAVANKMVVETKEARNFSTGEEDWTLQTKRGGSLSDKTLCFLFIGSKGEYV
jgi:hypothetical protein